MTKLDALKIKMFQNKFGNMSSKEAFECAMLDDGIARDMSPTDPAKSRFMLGAYDLLNYAELLEKQEISHA